MLSFQGQLFAESETFSNYFVKWRFRKFWLLLFQTQICKRVPHVLFLASFISFLGVKRCACRTFFCAAKVRAVAATLCSLVPSATNKAWDAGHGFRGRRPRAGEAQEFEPRSPIWAGIALSGI